MGLRFASLETATAAPSVYVSSLVARYRGSFENLKQENAQRPESHTCDDVLEEEALSLAKEALCR